MPPNTYHFKGVKSDIENGAFKIPPTLAEKRSFGTNITFEVLFRPALPVTVDSIPPLQCSMITIPTLLWTLLHPSAMPWHASFLLH